MARTKKSNTTAITSETEVVAETESTEVETAEEKSVETQPVVKSEKVWIKNPMNAFKKIRVLKEVYPFDGEGKSLVSAKDAEIFLTLPGYEIVK